MQQLDLHGGEPFWLVRNGLGLVVPPLDRGLACDVVVIGGGVTGAFAARALSDAGLSVVVLDRRHIGRGSTAASTALLQYDLDVPLFELRERLGERDAERAYLLGVEGVALVRSLSEASDAGFRARRSLYFARGAKGIAQLRREMIARGECGLEVEWLGASELGAEYGLVADGAIRSSVGAEIDPFRLTQHLLATCYSRGVAVHDRTEVTAIDEGDASVSVHTRSGNTVQARWVVHASGFEAARDLPRRAVSLSSTFAVLSEPLPVEHGAWSDKALLWEFKKPYFYARWFEDRLLFGGRDVRFRNALARDRLIPSSARALCHDMRTLAPMRVVEPAFAWAGTFGSTDDGLGYIGALPGRPRTLFALGFGGNGITTSALASRIVTDLVLGRQNDDARIYRFGR
jgi:glycine/D-amino acid oxidase-like deaminating enzyme